MSAFITADGELVDIDKLYWLGIGKTSVGCADMFRTIFLSYLRKSDHRSLNAFVLGFHY